MVEQTYVHKLVEGTLVHWFHYEHPQPTYEHRFVQPCTLIELPLGGIREENNVECLQFFIGTIILYGAMLKTDLRS